MNGFLEDRLEWLMITVNSHNLSIDVAVKLAECKNNSQKLLFSLSIIFLKICE